MTNLPSVHVHYRPSQKFGVKYHYSPPCGAVSTLKRRSMIIAGRQRMGAEASAGTAFWERSRGNTMRTLSEILEMRTTRSPLSHGAVREQEVLKEFLSQLCLSPALTNDCQEIVFSL